jgi:hypothetical protein
LRCKKQTKDGAQAATWNFFLPASMFALRFKMANLSSGVKEHAAPFFDFVFLRGPFSALFTSLSNSLCYL